MTNFEFCRDSIHSKTTESCLLLFLCTLAYTKRELAFEALVLHRGDEERTDGPTGYRYA